MAEETPTVVLLQTADGETWEWDCPYCGETHILPNDKARCAVVTGCKRKPGNVRLVRLNKKAES